MTIHDGPRPRTATRSATDRWTVTGLWLAVVAITAAFSALTPTHAATPVELGVGRSGVAARFAADPGRVDPLVENALITARSGTLDPVAAAAAAADLEAGLRGLGEVSSVAGPVTSEDGSAVLVRATTSRDPDPADARGPALKAVLARVQAAHPGLRVEEVGRQPRVVAAVLRPVLAHPRIATAASVTVLLALAAPLLGIPLHNTDVAD